MMSIEHVSFSLLRQPIGKYLILKDPHANLIRLYSLPDGTFESEVESSEDEKEEEDQ